MQCDVVNLDNETVGTVDLEDTVFGLEVRRDILARAVNWQLAKRRAGTHKVKTRNEVAGTSKKPFRQKGTGRARQGSLKGPHQRGGGIVFGPQPRDHAHDLPKKVRRLALKTALSAKQATGALVVLDKAELAEAKTKALAERAAKLGWRSVLLIDGNAMNPEFVRAARNLVGIDLLPSRGANVYDILRRDTLVLTRSAVDELQERLR
ncbi:MAG: 50S ribosomal protein L4 [Rhodospirillales bacterium]|nr:MAG: 50S ribosomal protein L4 [Rhodospirillales bacterium]